MTTLPAPAANAAPLPINSIQDLQTLGAIVAQTKLFGKRNPCEGLVIVAMCQQKRMSWLDFMQNFHMIQGVVSKKADAMLADLHRIGGTHKVLARTPEKAEAYFKLGDCEYTSTVTWQECLAEPFVYIGQEQDVVAMLQSGQKPPLKPKYSTPRSRKQMLWARCVSDGIHVVAPECGQGIYTPEEVADFTADPQQNFAAPSSSDAQPTTTHSLTPVVQGAAPSSPFASEQCPVGPLAGRRWDSLDTPVLQQALAGTSPRITTEMKDYIRAVLKQREEAAAEATPETEQEAANA